MKKLTTKELSALLVIVTGLNVIAWYLNYKWETNTSGLTIASTIIGVVSLAVPTVGYYIVWLWYKIAEVLGWVNSRIILSILFFLFLSPLALLYRLFNKDTLQIKKRSLQEKPLEGSMFVDRDHQYETKDFEEVW